MGRKKTIEINIDKKMTVEPKGIFKRVVKPFGNGAYIPFLKKFIGKDVIIIVCDKIKD